MMTINDEQLNSVLSIVDVTNDQAFRDAMTELSLELVNSMYEGNINTDRETIGVIQSIILLSLSSNAYKNNDPKVVRH